MHIVQTGLTLLYLYCGLLECNAFENLLDLFIYI